MTLPDKVGKTQKERLGDLELEVRAMAQSVEGLHDTLSLLTKTIDKVVSSSLSSSSSKGTGGANINDRLLDIILEEKTTKETGLTATVKELETLIQGPLGNLLNGYMESRTNWVEVAKVVSEGIQNVLGPRYQGSAGSTHHGGTVASVKRKAIDPPTSDPPMEELPNND